MSTGPFGVLGELSTTAPAQDCAGQEVMTMESIAMRGCRVVAGGGTLGALVVFALVFAGLSALGPAALPLAVAVTWAGRAITRVWGYALP